MSLLLKYDSILNELKENEYVTGIIIFGSYANNNVKPLSDLDVCIFTKKGISNYEKNNILSYANDELDISLFSDLPLSLQYKLLREGKVFYLDFDLTNLRIKTTNSWFDFRVGLNKLYKSRGYKGLKI